MENFIKSNESNESNLSEKYNSDENGFVDFGEISRGELQKQSQYGSRYVDGFRGEYPNLGEGLRFEGGLDDYHSLKIHKDDIEEFVRRFKEVE